MPLHQIRICVCVWAICADEGNKFAKSSMLIVGAVVCMQSVGHCHGIIYRPNNGLKCWEWQPKRKQTKRLILHKNIWLLWSDGQFHGIFLSLSILYQNDYQFFFSCCCWCWCWFRHGIATLFFELLSIKSFSLHFSLFAKKMIWCGPHHQMFNQFNYFQVFNIHANPWNTQMCTV